MSVVLIFERFLVSFLLDKIKRIFFELFVVFIDVILFEYLLYICVFKYVYRYMYIDMLYVCFKY